MMRLTDRFPGLMLWHTVAAVAAVFAAKALLYWAADWWGLGPLYNALAGPSLGRLRKRKKSYAKQVACGLNLPAPISALLRHR